MFFKIDVLKIFQDWQKTTCAEVPFLIQLLTSAQVFSNELFQIFSNTSGQLFLNSLSFILSLSFKYISGKFHDVFTQTTTKQLLSKF